MRRHFDGLLLVPDGAAILQHLDGKNGYGPSFTAYLSGSPCAAVLAQKAPTIDTIAATRVRAAVLAMCDMANPLKCPWRIST